MLTNTSMRVHTHVCIVGQDIHSEWCLDTAVGIWRFWPRDGEPETRGMKSCRPFHTICAENSEMSGVPAVRECFWATFSDKLLQGWGGKLSTWSALHKPGSEFYTTALFIFPSRLVSLDDSTSWDLTAAMPLGRLWAQMGTIFPPLHRINVFLWQQQHGNKERGSLCGFGDSLS